MTPYDIMAHGREIAAETRTGANTAQKIGNLFVQVAAWLGNIADGCVTAAKLAAGSITRNKQLRFTLYLDEIPTLNTHTSLTLNKFIEIVGSVAGMQQALTDGAFFRMRYGDSFYDAQVTFSESGNYEIECDISGTYVTLSFELSDGQFSSGNLYAWEAEVKGGDASSMKYREIGSTFSFDADAGYTQYFPNRLTFTDKTFFSARSAAVYAIRAKGKGQTARLLTLHCSETYDRKPEELYEIGDRLFLWGIWGGCVFIYTANISLGDNPYTLTLTHCYDMSSLKDVKET